MRARAFTLVELLIALAVIALLISIALPALARSVRFAKATACTAGLKQITTLTIALADERQAMPEGEGAFPLDALEAPARAWRCPLDSRLASSPSRASSYTYLGLETFETRRDASKREKALAAKQAYRKFTLDPASPIFKEVDHTPAHHHVALFCGRIHEN